MADMFGMKMVGIQFLSYRLFMFLAAFTLTTFMFYSANFLRAAVHETRYIKQFVQVNYNNYSWSGGGVPRRSLVGVIWPQSDRGLPELNDRITEQKKFIDEFWPIIGPNGTRRPVNKTKVILKLGYFNFEDLKKGQEFFLKDGCPVNSCVLTDDESLHETADALIMSQYSHVHSARFLPKPTHQIWIAQHWESPRHNRIDTDLVKDLINWTASYRKDSTVPFAYGHYEKITDKSQTNETFNYAAGKNRTVAWVVGNCGAANNRNWYAEELGKHIQVDIYGACGFLRCPVDGDKCYSWLAQHYKFFLSFENSNCQDYITEKLHRNALKHHILPIALGTVREEYVVAAPPHSYIHVDDFSSPRELAQYLHVLDKNDTLYNTYFEWKKHWRSSYFEMRYWCRLCMMLHLADKQHYVHWYQDYSDWWNRCSS